MNQKSLLTGVQCLSILGSIVVLTRVFGSVANQIAVYKNKDTPQKIIDMSQNKYEVVDNRGLVNNIYHFTIAQDCQDTLEAIRDNSMIGTVTDNGKTLVLSTFDSEKKKFTSTVQDMRLQ